MGTTAYPQIPGKAAVEGKRLIPTPVGAPLSSPSPSLLDILWEWRNHLVEQYKQWLCKAWERAWENQATAISFLNVELYHS